MIARLALGAALGGSLLGAAPSAQADLGILCQYPTVGVAVNVGPGAGFACDGPTEINGAHWHCQGGGLNLGLGFAGTAVGNGATLGFGQAGQGIGGVSCNWRCPDGVDAPQPNPPGMWREYLVPMNTTNYCRDHMQPNGFWSAPVLPTEGIPPAGEIAPQPGEPMPPQPIPPPLPTQPPAEPPIPPIAPGEPNA